ncbi:bifunctional UDP-N-acetylglucosamine diphosphorylase/glucosamine-1-phosphate N-acetyltransferase GlmU [Aetokthonos hydrillicola Thurmond2011]|jgi:bifunctional UDP-N-acetylglucosamine pyrophosphorylase/glucosamine-1-phosphate N-acetyltransferase|uniref:Bifunctional protein GlmU n=1 Tax=Aetokthonos hydrillicola Thurmond2011 TaxID=2712845 RepID=A0AAP5MAG2_9CYAN|nr:bifunctional UDP-N-acetylglucosamine diphosphorylase/glucosamine-1-phosphate N-acetyltransferase GlmU [Aetokthonos hydrillicola]MBO3461374.1 bifunctional UDP-N-acetylglucosamine diphosphorylase/glucosamine-1-phosphate N-acetyltransferase GlmU [Aetokthonos hydrillicola CCALA 1050]MBW4586810.1 bifunctional UDP-N-acetylglucosamine diphosphorylase/glucosamine-1-phosphate N-acetyltransferase GlmU [Aetokthonos hydrillicola CCALA 1050]MDR9895833.1 bifunctional UDP-N-acetylglucosamine diphosphorylase
MIIVAILAAGRGTRMKSNLPKVLHSLGGQTLIERVLNNSKSLLPLKQIVIVGYQALEVKAAMQSILDIEFVEQTEQLGTGHAIQQLLPHLENYTGDLLVLSGDVPLLRTQTLEELVKVHQTHQNAATLLTAQLSEPKGYGRVFCDSDNIVQKIIEDKDCTPEQRQNCRINAGIYCFNWPSLAKVLPHLQPNNAQKEYYLPDVVSQMEPVMAVDVKDYQEILGINDRLQLATAYEILQKRVKEKWMAAGVTLIDPTSVTIDETVELQPDIIIEPQTHLRGNTSIKTGSRIGPGSLVENSQLGENVTVQYSVVTDSIVQEGTRVGPYAHLRGHVEVGNSCRIGNFVELKNTKLGDRTNVAHLAYLGDTTAGNRVNIGAGTITANYDGVKKHRTILGNHTSTGSNSVLIAPLTLGNNVYVAAGSTISKDVPDDCLVIARARQVVKPGWSKKDKTKES